MDETGYITPELLCIILSRIPTKELFRLQHVCKYWRELCWDVQSELDFSFSLQAPLSMNDDVLIDVVRRKVRQPAITSLSLNYCRAITNKSLREIGSSLHNLRSLSLAWCDNITIDGLLCLTTLTRLESLKFRNCTLINTNGWQLTDKLTHLTSFTSKTVDDNFLTKLIQSCPDLKYLNLYGSKVTTIQALPKLTNLHYLNLSNSSVTASLTTLGQMTRLTELNLADIAPSRIITDILTSLTNLVSLNLAGNSHLVNSAVGVLTKLVNLEYLNIEGAVNVDMGVIPYLDRFVHLKHLRRHGAVFC